MPLAGNTLELMSAAVFEFQSDPITRSRSVLDAEHVVRPGRRTPSEAWSAFLTEALEEVGIQPHVPVQHGPTTSLYYRDPDGNMVELQIDNMAR